MDAKGARALVERLTREGRVYEETEAAPPGELALGGDVLPAEHAHEAEPVARHGAERAA
jgi:hypothetical protein